MSIDFGYYVYVHIRATTGEPFYYGKGKHGRQYDMFARTVWHKKVVAKHGVTVRTIAAGLSERAAWELEKQMIAQARTLGENIVNITQGGEGGWSKRASAAAISRQRKQKLAWFDSKAQSKLGKRGAPVTHAACREKKTGFFSSETQRLNCQKGAIASAIARVGQKWWIHPVTRHVVRSFNRPSPEYINGRGKLSRRTV